MTSYHNWAMKRSDFQAGFCRCFIIDLLVHVHKFGDLNPIKGRWSSRKSNRITPAYLNKLLEKHLTKKHGIKNIKKHGSKWHQERWLSRNYMTLRNIKETRHQAYLHLRFKCYLSQKWRGMRDMDRTQWVLLIGRMAKEVTKGHIFWPNGAWEKHKKFH